MSASDSTWIVALAVDGAGLDQHVLGLAAVRAGVHAQRAADRARDAAIEGEAGDAGIRRRARELDVGHSRAGAQPVARLDVDLREAAAEADRRRPARRRRAPAGWSRGR